MNEQIVGMALIGTGGVADLHARGMQAQPHGKLIGAYSRNPTNLAEFAAKYDIKAYQSIEELLEDEAVNAVAIVSPTTTHMPFAIQCMEAGKDVLLEKPVGASIEEVEQLIKAAKQTGQRCMPSHNYIYGPEVRRAKAYIEAGRLGQMSSMWLIYNLKQQPDLRTPALALLWDVCTHHVYAMLYLVGRPISVSAIGTNVDYPDPKVIDQLSIQAELANGCIVNLWASYGVDDKTSSPWGVYYKVLGTAGGFTYSWNDLQFGQAPLPALDLAGYHESFRYAQQYFLEECIDQSKPPLSTLNDARDVISILNAIELALEERRWIEVSYQASE